MNRSFTISILMVVAMASCNLTDGQPPRHAKTVTYSYACVDSTISGEKFNKTISKTTKILRNLAVDDKDITDEIQNEYGDAFHKDAIETKTFVLLNDPLITAQLNTVLNDLLRVREDSSKIRYSIYLLNDTAINAFTFGGHIYITKAMYDRCKHSHSLLYFIVGHEIGHSEKGHIKKTIQEMQLSEKIFGEDGLTFFQIKQLLTASFNQKHELEADYYGVDLAYQLDHDLCSAVKFWTNMATQENEYNRLEDFFRTHPFSSLRAQCLKDHLTSNFGKSCSL